jgi:hypothetical protein
VKSNDNGTPPTSGGWKPSAPTVTGRPVPSQPPVVPPAPMVRAPSAPRDRKPALVPGTLLVGQMLTTALPLAPGQEVVALALKDGEYPLGIQIGDTVSAYYVTNKNVDKNGQAYLTNGAFTTIPIVANVRVYDVGALNPSGSLDVSLVLGQQYTNSIAQAVSGGNLVLAFDKHTQ